MSGRYELVSDAQDFILEVNQDWIDFALANWDADFQPGWVLGRRLWGFIADQASQYIYRMLVDKVRHQGQELSFPFRCDSPSLRRHLQMTIQPRDDGGLLWVSQLLRQEQRDPPVPFLHHRDLAQAHLLRVCSWCLRACLPQWLPRQSGQPPVGAWLEMEELLPGLAQEFAGFYPHVTHGICPACYASLEVVLSQT